MARTRYDACMPDRRAIGKGGGTGRRPDEPAPRRNGEEPPP
ncbi:MAG: hypothetical protein AVDCRST_MAG73-993 [uncultured Thermomicrobiales bacterium]|uniref:Uncharacterized protein n=1 Tax=uncultured Thermomicrobiales bacterium TaxID=1645740 RepID=A0A6J4TTU8_9BACT|nr:MAG: hypothetical protein AVDCRST_MAG73-993 [uncultured Thermomicrobiales bacterium]